MNQMQTRIFRRVPVPTVYSLPEIVSPILVVLIEMGDFVDVPFRVRTMWSSKEDSCETKNIIEQNP